MRGLGIAFFRDRLAAIAGPATAVMLLAGAQAEPEAAQSKARNAMARVEAKFSAIKSIRYNAERTVKIASGSETEEWSFCYAEPASLRIECRKPLERILVSDGKVFWEYVPGARKALKTDLAGMTEAAARKFLSGILARVAVDGIRIGDCDEMARRAVSVSATSPSGAVIRIEGVNPRYLVEIDTVKNALIKTEINDAKDELLARTTASEFVEILPGVWYPTEVAVECRTDKGIVSSQVRLRRLEANADPGREAFAIEIPRGVAVETRKPTAAERREK